MLFVVFSKPTPTSEVADMCGAEMVEFAKGKTEKFDAHVPLTIMGQTAHSNDVSGRGRNSPLFYLKLLTSD